MKNKTVVAPVFLAAKPAFFKSVSLCTQKASVFLAVELWRHTEHSWNQHLPGAVLTESQTLHFCEPVDLPVNN